MRQHPTSNKGSLLRSLYCILSRLPSLLLKAVASRSVFASSSMYTPTNSDSQISKCLYAHIKDNQKINHHNLPIPSSLHRYRGLLAFFSTIFVIVKPTGVLLPLPPLGLGPGLCVRLGAALGAAERLWLMCACTRCPAASAEQRLNSPASTPAAIIRASCRALSPGFEG